MSDPITIALSTDTAERLRALAERGDGTVTTQAARYVDEGVRQEAHPLIRFTSGPSGRRATLVGCGLDVWETAATVRDNDGSIAEAAVYLGIDQRLVTAAVAYAVAYAEEIDAEIAENDAAYARGRQIADDAAASQAP